MAAIQQIYSIYDSKVRVYHNPFVQNNDAEAERTFSQLAKDNNTAIGQFPTDYDLFHVGEYDPDSGKIKGVTPRHIIKAAQALNPKAVMTNVRKKK